VASESGAVMKILAATDLSDAAERSVDLAALLAERLGDSLELVHVVEPPPPLLPELAMAVPDLQRQMEQIANRRLEERSARLRRGRLDIGWKALSGFPEEALLEHAAHERPRFLALGTHRRRAPARLFLGSVAERIIRRTMLPVLVVPAVSGPLALPPPSRPLRIVVGIDHSPASDAALAWLRGLAGTAACHLSLVHLYAPLREHTRFGIEDVADPQEASDEVATLLEKELRPRINELLGGMTATLRVVPSVGREAELLAREAQLSGADLLVVGTNQRHQRRGGSTAVETVRAAATPVLCVPAVAEGLPRPAAPRPVFRTLLVPVDLSGASGAAVETAYQMLRGRGGVVELLHVVSPSREGLDSGRGPQLEKQLCTLVPGREDHGILARTNIVEHELPAIAILQAAERLAADAIVLASHQDRGLRRALVGSTAEQVMRGATRPVVVVPVPRT
jgi:nucleotide-binding universal stress UspA family protein